MKVKWANVFISAKLINALKKLSLNNYRHCDGNPHCVSSPKPI